MGDGRAQTAAHDHRQIGQIIANVRALVRCESELVAQALPCCELVLGALDHMSDTKIRGAARHRRRAAARDPGHYHAGALQHFHS